MQVIETDSLLFELPDKYILCGEDDKDDEDILQEIFGNVDGSFYLFFVNNANKLLTVLHSMPDNRLPCLILLDYNMPQLNGAEVLQELKKFPRYERIPKVIWSTSGSITFRNTCLQLGANEYLIKPSNVNDLLTLARHILSFC